MKTYNWPLIFIAFSFIFSFSKDASSNYSQQKPYYFQIESNGQVLPTINHRGKTYIEGRQGQSYGIRIFNQSPSRIEAVITVDGTDVINGKTGNYTTNRGYIVAPFSSLLVEGYRTSWSNIASFYFTDSNYSYSAQTGNRENVGVIGVAIFDERTRRPRPTPLRKNHSYQDSPAPRHESAQSAPRSSSGSAPPGEYHIEELQNSIGTGYGSSQYSPASPTTFSRRTRNPAFLQSIFYDDRQSLVKRGVLPSSQKPINGPRPFPNNPNGFVPPPPCCHFE